MDRSRTSPHRRSVGRWPVLALLAGALAMLLIACGDDTADDDTGPAATDGTDDGTATDDTAQEGAGGGAGLSDRTFVVTDSTGRDLVAGTEVTFTFEGPRLAVRGCNTASGEYELADGELRWVGEPLSTMMACEQDLMDQDAWLAELLVAGVEVSEGDDGVVTLAGTVDGDDITLTLTESGSGSGAGAAPASIVGPTWTLTTIVDGNTASSVPAGVDPPTLTITDGGGVQLFAGCNQGGGAVEVGESTLTFEPLALTRMACDGDAGTIEATVLLVLDGEVDFELDGSTLTLTSGDRALVFEAA